MNITINGTSKHLPSVKNVSDIVALFCKQPKNVITELNGSIVPCGEWEKITVKEGDSIELVTFVGGG